MHLELKGLLLSNQGIPTIEHQFSTCKTCYVSLKNNKMTKFALVNCLWIGATPKILPKLTMMEETLITCYYCHTILVKLKYINKASTTSQHALKGNVISFAKDLESVIKLLNKSPLSLKSLPNIIAIHFVGSSHPLI
jgi:hypothetical protein